MRKLIMILVMFYISTSGIGYYMNSAQRRDGVSVSECCDSLCSEDILWRQSRESRTEESMRNMLRRHPRIKNDTTYLLIHFGRPDFKNITDRFLKFKGDTLAEKADTVVIYAYRDRIVYGNESESFVNYLSFVYDKKTGVLIYCWSNDM